MIRLRISVLVILSICVIPLRSDANFLQSPRKLAAADRNSEIPIDQVMPPSPSPVNLDSWNARSPANVGPREIKATPPEPEASPPELEASCGNLADRCDIKKYMITACVPYLVDGSQASYVLVKNGGESPHKLNIVVHPLNITLAGIIISRQEVKKVELPPNTGQNSSLSLTIRDSHCIIKMGSLITPQTSYTDYLTPINGTYLFFLTAISIGGICACCKLVKRKRHMEGVPYQELEMEKHQEPDPSFVIESSDDWDQEWENDDDWNLEKADGSQGSDGDVSKGNRSPLKYVDTTQWGNDWDD